MPVSNIIDWQSLKTAAIALGNVREAARRAGSSLPSGEQQRFIERVNKRSQRERWITKDNPPQPILTHNEKPLSKQVQDGSNVLRQTLSENGRAARIGFSKAGRKVAEKLARMPAVGLLENETSRSARDWFTINSGTHGWEEKEGERSPLNLNVLGNALVQVNTGKEQAGEHKGE